MAASVLDTITAVSDTYGLPPAIAISTAYVESGLNPTAVGDNGTSFGLFQLHEGGELGSLNARQAFDPRTNASVAIPEMAAVYKAHPDWTPGEVAAVAQRPANPSAYADQVNAAYNELAKKGSLPVAGVSTSSWTHWIKDAGNIANLLNPVTGAETVVGGATHAVSGVSAAWSAFSGVASNLTSSSFWRRIGIGAVGVLAAIIGLVFLLRRPVTTASSFAKKATP